MTRANNSFNLTGRLARDPEVVGSSSGGTGTDIVRLRLAVDGYDRQAKQKKADFFSVTVFGDRAVQCATYLTQGSYVSVTGELRENNYTDKQGNKRYETQLTASDVVFGPKTGGGGNTNSSDPFGFGGS
jgi:single-strand DNA-binding protein